jgi:hypothetical protein
MSRMNREMDDEDSALRRCSSLRVMIFVAVLCGSFCSLRLVVQRFLIFLSCSWAGSSLWAPAPTQLIVFRSTSIQTERVRSPTLASRLCPLSTSTVPPTLTKYLGQTTSSLPLRCFTEKFLASR